MTVVVELAVAGRAAGSPQGSAQLTVRNETAAPIAFQRVQLESPSLAYEVVDTAGRPVPLPPPPVPDPDAAPMVVEPGSSWSTEHPAIVPDWTEPGRYRVRGRVYVDGAPDPIVSDWADLQI